MDSMARRANCSALVDVLHSVSSLANLPSGAISMRHQKGAGLAHRFLSGHVNS